jgi:hypothetical protein
MFMMYFIRNLFIVVYSVVVTPEKQLGALSKCQQRELCVECSIGHLFNVTRRRVFGG